MLLQPIPRVYQSIQFSPFTQSGYASSGGLVKFTPYTPHENDSKQQIGVQLGIDNQINIYGSFQGLGNKKWKTSLFLGRNLGDGIRENNPYKQEYVVTQLERKWKSDRQLHFQLQYDHQQANLSQHGITPYSSTYSPEFHPQQNENLSQNRILGSVQHKNTINANWKVKTNAYWSLHHYDWWQQDVVFSRKEWFDKGIKKPVSIEESENIQDLIRIGNDRSFVLDKRKINRYGIHHEYVNKHKVEDLKAQLNVGLRYDCERLQIDSFQLKSINNQNQADSREFWYGKNSVLFAQENIHIGKAKFYLGIQYQHRSQTRTIATDSIQKYLFNEALWLPKLGLVFPFKNWRIHAEYQKRSTPISMQQLIDTKFKASNNEIQLLTPTSWNGNISFQKAGKWGDCSVNFYHTLYKNKLEIMPNYYLLRTDGIKVKGIELKATVKMQKWSYILPQVQLNYTFAHSQFIETEIQHSLTTENPIILTQQVLPYLPKHQWSVRFNYVLNKKWAVQFDIHSRSKVYTDPENNSFINTSGNTGPISPITTYTIRLKYQLNSHCTFQCTGLNLSDEMYIDSRLGSTPQIKGTNGGIYMGNRSQYLMQCTYQF